MEATDQLLVRRLAREGDPEAFRVLLGRYADMVYSTCLRVLRDDAQAADVTQETFFQMFKGAGRITESPGGWLHRVATRRAIDLVRQDISRRKREEAYARSLSDPESSWSEVAPLVDTALDQLPDEYRDILVQHFLERKSMTQIAAALGISQPTISRRVAEGLELVRKALRDQGVVLGVVPLQLLLLHTAEAAPEALLKALGKMSLAQAACTKATGSGLSWLGSSGAAKLAGAGAVAALILNLSWPDPEWTPTSPNLRQPAKAPEQATAVLPLPATPVPSASANPSGPPSNPTPPAQRVIQARPAPVFVRTAPANPEAITNALPSRPDDPSLAAQPNPGLLPTAFPNVQEPLTGPWLGPQGYAPLAPKAPSALAPTAPVTRLPAMVKTRTANTWGQAAPVNSGLQKSVVLGPATPRPDDRSARSKRPDRP